MPLSNYDSPIGSDGQNLKENKLQVSGDFNPTQQYTDLTMPDGQRVRLLTELLRASALPSNSVSLAVPPTDALSDLASGDQLVIPMIEEELQVTKQTVTTGKVVLHKSIQPYDAQLDEVLSFQTFEVQRIAVGQVVEAVPDIRQEGNTTIYPVLEERLVLTKQLVLKEEVHITKRDTEVHDKHTITLYRETISVERS